MDDNSRKEKIERVIENRQEGVVVLQDIHDPHNAAAVWRSTDAFGWQKVYLIFEQEEVFNPKKMGRASSASANKWLDFKIFKSTKECLDELHKEGYKVYATVLDKEAKSIYETDMSGERVAIMMGNEHRGLTEEAIKMADVKVYIPMRGMVQSLNLSVCASIMLFEASRQRKDSYPIDQGKKEELKDSWR